MNQTKKPADKMDKANTGVGEQPQPCISVIIAAYNEQERIANTIRAASKLPGVKQVVVVDDGSTDHTLREALDAGAKVVKHLQNHGKATAMETGANAVLCHGNSTDPQPILLFLDADLQKTALAAKPLIEPVLAGEADCTVAIFPKLAGAGGKGFVKRLAAGAIKKATGFDSEAPLSGQRCIRWNAFEASCPLGRGWAVETVMTIKLLLAGYRLLEVPCEMNHRVSRNDLKSQLHRLDQYRQIWWQVRKMELSRVKASRERIQNAQVNEAGAYSIPVM